MTETIVHAATAAQKEPHMTTTKTMLDLFQSARLASVPLVGIRTADQMATTEAIKEAQAEYPIVTWDAVRGIAPANKLGIAAVFEMAGLTPRNDKERKEALDKIGLETVDFVAAMRAVAGLPKNAIAIAFNAHRQLQAQEPLAVAQPVQALANLRDVLKQNFRMVVLLGPEMAAPPEIDQDVVVLDDPLPGREVLETVIKELHNSAKLPQPTPAVMAQAIEAVTGLTQFSAEQQTAMSLSEAGLDVPALWERKRTAIEQTDGLAVHRGTETFDDVIGNESVKARLRTLGRGRRPIGVVVRIDEGADVFANVESSTNDQKMDQQKVLLTEMETNRWQGCIFCGVSGTGKSLLAGAFGNEVSVPQVDIDFGAMEAKYVGESEARLRTAMRTIKAVGNGNAFFILTCNSMRGIRPQFQRRFRRGVFFFDLLTIEQQAAMWSHYMAKYAIPDQVLPPHDGWTGAEIADCCEDAANTGRTLIQAAAFIMPIAQARGNEIEAMRMEAHGRFLDANKPGTYSYKERLMEHALRAIKLPAGKKAN